MEVIPDCFELLVSVAIEEVGALGEVSFGVFRHLGGWGDRAWIRHPAEVVVLAKPSGAEQEVHALDLEGGGGFLIADGVAGGAAEAAGTGTGEGLTGFSGGIDQSWHAGGGVGGFSGNA